MGSCFTVKKYFKVLVILAGFLLITLSLIVNSHGIQADSWNTYQITESNLNNLNIDVDIDSTGTPHIVYERNGNIYYKCGLGNEELVASGRRPAIAVGPDGMPRVAFIGSTSGNYLTARIGGLWQTPVNISTSSGEIDIDVDNNNYTHIVYVADTLGDGYVDVVYANDAGGVFVSEVIWNGFYWYESGGKTGRYYDNPRIKMDSTGAYHIVATHHALDGGLGWTEHAYYVVYKSNSSEAISPYRGNVGVTLPFNAIAIGENRVRIIYIQGGVLNYAVPSNPWSESSLGALSQPAIASAGANIGLAYVGNSIVMYMVDSGTGFGSPIEIDTGSGPAVGMGSTFIYYLKSDGSNDEIFLKTDSILESAPSIIQNPSNQSVIYGNDVSFSAIASGMPTPEIQWQVSSDGGSTFIDIPGATASTLYITRPPVTASGWQYRAVFTNNLGSTVTTPATLTVSPAIVFPNVTIRDKVYDGTTNAEIESMTMTGVISGDDISLVGGTACFVDPRVGDDKQVLVSGFALSGEDAYNYKLSTTTISTNADIFPAEITPHIGINSKIYDGTTAAEINMRSLTGVIGSDKVALSGGVAVFTDRNAGSEKTVIITELTLSGDDAENYVLSSTSVTATADIMPLAITVTAVSDSKVYDGTVSSSGVPIISGELGEGDIPEFVQHFDSKHAGTGKLLIPSGQMNDGNNGENYSVTFVPVSDGVIIPRDITVTATDATKEYDGTTGSTETPLITEGSLARNDSAEFYQTYNDKNVGTVKIITPAGFVDDGNNGLNYKVTFVSSSNGVITPRLITVTSVVDIKTYDGTNLSTATPILTTGTLADGDTPRFSQSFDNPDAGSGKTLTPAGFVNDGNEGQNYQITFIAINSGQINPCPITVQADSQTKVYGDPDLELTYSIIAGSLVNGDNFTGELSRGPGENVGSYPITMGTLALNSNYSLNFIESNLTITPRPIAIAADEKAKIYGDIDPELTYSIISGSLVFLDSVTGALTREPGENVGEYSITRGTLEINHNYELTFVEAKLRVMPRQVTIAADSQTKVYGDPDPDQTYSIVAGSLVNGDTFMGELSREPGENVGGYLIDIGNLSLGSNYTLSLTGTNYLIINKRAITVTAVTDTKIYDGTTSSSAVPLIISGNLAFDDSALFVQTFDTKDAGTNKWLTPSGRVADGNDGNNYAVTFISVDTGTIEKASPAVSWRTPDEISYGTNLSSAQLNAESDVPGVFIYTPGAGVLLDPGIHILNVEFIPAEETNYYRVSKQVNLNVKKATPEITLTSSLNPSLTGQTVTFTAKVGSVVSIPGGTVTFKDGNTTLSVQTLNNIGSNYSQAAFTTNTLSVGNHTIIVEYSGDNYFLALTSTALNQMVVAPSMGGGGWAPVLNTVLLEDLTSTSSLRVDDGGTVQSAVQLHSPEKKVLIIIPERTRLHTAAGGALTSLGVKLLSSPPVPPQQSIVILAYEFSPAGANFSQALTVTLKYDPLNLPAGVNEKGLYVAYYDGKSWQKLESIVDLQNKTVSAKVTHFSIYGILGQIAVQSIPPQASTPVPIASQPVVSSPAASPESINAPKPSATPVPETATALPTEVVVNTTIPTGEINQEKSVSSGSLPMVIVICLIAGMVAVLLVLTFFLRRPRNK